MQVTVLISNKVVVNSQYMASNFVICCSIVVLIFGFKFGRIYINPKKSG